MKRKTFAVRLEKENAFTLVEMIVSMAVLIMIVVLVANLINGAMMTVNASGKQMDSDGQARAVFDRMALDFAKMVKRPGLDYSSFKPTTSGTASNDLFAFYSEVNGYVTSGTSTVSERSPVSLVAYRFLTDPYASGATQALQRLSECIGWKPTAALRSMAYAPEKLSDAAQWPDLFISDPNPAYQPIGEQVFRMEYVYLLKSAKTPSTTAHFSVTPWDTTLGHTSANGLDDVAAIVVAIAVLDSSSRAMVTSYNDLVNAFADADGISDIETQWLPVVNSPSFAATAKIPVAAAQGVHIYQRYFYLDKL